MQTSNFIFNSDSISAASMGASINGTSFDIAEAIRYAAIAVWSAGSTPVGLLLIQGSNDNTNFVTVSSQAVSGNTGSLIYNESSAGYRYVRAVYTRTSGSGTLTVSIAAKG